MRFLDDLEEDLLDEILIYNSGKWSLHATFLAQNISTML